MVGRCVEERSGWARGVLEKESCPCVTWPGAGESQKLLCGECGYSDLLQVTELISITYAKRNRLQSRVTQHICNILQVWNLSFESGEKHRPGDLVHTGENYSY